MNGETVVTEVHPTGSAAPVVPGTVRRAVGGLTVDTHVTALAGRSLANRRWLMLPGLAMMALSSVGFVLLALSEHTTMGATIVVTISLVGSMIWTGIFGSQARAISRARAAETMQYGLITDMHGHDLMSADPASPVAVVLNGKVLLNPFYFDLTHNRSRLDPETQRSVMREELRHITYQTDRGLIGSTSRTTFSLISEELWVNVFMPLRDFFGRLRVPTSQERRETNVSPRLAAERARLTTLLHKLELEQQTPGSQEFEQMIFISDQHGTIDVFDDLIMDAILRSHDGSRH